MKPSDRCLDMVKEFEGYHTALPDGRCEAYLDKLAKPHVWTIGYGITGPDIGAGLIWTHDQAEAALRERIEERAAIVQRLVTVELNQKQLDALTSFVYNIGPTKFKGSTLLRKLNEGDYFGAELEFAKWKYAGGKVWPGLVDRREKERSLFARGTSEMIHGWAKNAPMPKTAERETPRPSKKDVAVAVGSGAAGTAAGIGASFLEPSAILQWQSVAAGFGKMPLWIAVGLGATLGAIYITPIIMRRFGGQQ